MGEESITRPSGFRIEVVVDDDAQNPTKDWDMVGTMVLIYHCRNNFGHQMVMYEAFKAIAKDPNNIVLPVYLYDHSGITINTTGFSCDWDSGQVGIMYCTKEKAIHEFGKKICTKKVREAAESCMRSEVEIVDDYLTGNVWGFQIFDPENEEVDSCWGFFGDSKYCMEQAVASVEYFEREAEKENVESTYWSEREVVTELPA